MLIERYLLMTKKIKMQFKNLVLAMLLIFSLSLSSLFAQESINASGGIASGSEGTVSYSAGQVFHKTHNGSTGSVSEGVQQAYEILLVTSNERANNLSLSVAIYPNPVADYLQLKVAEMDYISLHFQLYDISGKLLKQQEITDNLTYIDMRALNPGSYFIKISEMKQENAPLPLKTFKLIKN